jgi:hypothetical protein
MEETTQTVEQTAQSIEATTIEASNGFLSTNHEETTINANNSAEAESNTPIENNLINEGMVVEKMLTDQQQQPQQPQESQQSDKQADDYNLPKDLNIKNDSKFRENLYRLIISQLFYDGYQPIAVGLSNMVQVIKKKEFYIFYF